MKSTLSGIEPEICDSSTIRVIFAIVSHTAFSRSEGTVCLRVILYLGFPKKSIEFLGFPKFQPFPQKGGICFG